MNVMEKEMLSLLTDLRVNYGAVGIKTEFEGEGARIDETCRLKELTMLAGLPITLKIGGGEALTDIYMGKMIGVTNIVAPMIESAFAVEKFLEAIHKSFTEDELIDIKPEINVETTTGLRAFPEILTLREYGELEGVVIGRVDMARSMGLTSDEVEDDRVYQACLDIFSSSKKKYPKCTCTLGGVSNFATLDTLARFPAGTVDFYEQRKVIFSLNGSDIGKQREGLVKGLEFELMWYENKKKYYGAIADGDDAYIGMIHGKYSDMKARL